MPEIAVGTLLDHQARRLLERWRRLARLLKRGDPRVCSLARQGVAAFGAAAVEAAESGEWIPVTDSAWSLARVYLLAEEEDAGIETFRRICAAAERQAETIGPARRIALLQHFASLLVFRTPPREESDRVLGDLLELTDRHGDDRSRCWARCLHGCYGSLRGQSAEAEPSLAEATRDAEANGWFDIVACGRLELSWLVQHDDVSTRQGHCEAALDASRAAGDAYWEFASLAALAQVTRGRKPTESMLYLRRALGILERLQARSRTAAVLTNLADEEFVARRYDAMRANYERAIAVADAAGRHHTVRAAEANFGASLLFLGDHAGARTHLERGRVLAREERDVTTELFCLARLLALDTDSGRAHDARAALGYAFGLASRVTMPTVVLYFLHEATRVHIASGGYRDALQQIEGARSHPHVANSPELRIANLALEAEVFTALGDLERARDCVAQFAPGLSLDLDALLVDTVSLHWRAHDVLRRTNDPRAEQLLHDGYAACMTITRSLDLAERTDFESANEGRRRLVAAFRGARRASLN